MCGRINLTSAPHALAETFFLDEVPDLVPRYNISPGQEIAAVLPGGPGAGRLFRPLMWGLHPPRRPGEESGPRLINARAETVARKTSFAESFRERRCLIPVTGFYEWKKNGALRQPFLFRRRDHGLFALAGLWSRWEFPGGRREENGTILTCAANSLMRPVHHRMPVILPPSAWSAWLDSPAHEADGLQELLQPATPGELVAHPVTRRVNRPEFDDPACLEPVPEEGDNQLALF